MKWIYKPLHILPAYYQLEGGAGFEPWWLTNVEWRGLYFSPGMQWSKSKKLQKMHLMESASNCTWVQNLSKCVTSFDRSLGGSVGLHIFMVKLSLPGRSSASSVISIFLASPSLMIYSLFSFELCMSFPTSARTACVSFHFFYFSVGKKKIYWLCFLWCGMYRGRYIEEYIF